MVNSCLFGRFRIARSTAILGVMPGRSLGALLAAVAIAVAGLAAVAARSARRPRAPRRPRRSAGCAPAPAGWPDVRRVRRRRRPERRSRTTAARLGIGDGLRGAGVTIADVEYEWRRTARRARRRSGSRPRRDTGPARRRTAPPSTARRSSACSARAPTARASAGSSPTPTLRPISPFATGTYDPAGAVDGRRRRARPGRRPAHRAPGAGRRTAPLVPIESIPAVRAAIRAAVDAGIVVVEPAGNGGIDARRRRGPTWLTGPTAPGHSGALIVGAGGSASDAAGSTERRARPGSNFGARVDLQGVGAAVVTAGYGDGLGGSDDRAYTVLLRRHLQRERHRGGRRGGAPERRRSPCTGAPLTPAQVRALLVATGLPQARAGGRGHRAAPPGRRRAREPRRRAPAGRRRGPGRARPGRSRPRARRPVPAVARGRQRGRPPSRRRPAPRRVFRRRAGTLVVRLGASRAAPGDRRRPPGACSRGRVVLRGAARAGSS